MFRTCRYASGDCASPARRRSNSLAKAALLSAAMAAFLFSPHSSTQAAERVILVLDSSGSMAGKINGVPKIDIARNAVRDVLKTLQPGTELGLMAYGHRRKDDCSDIETLAEAAPSNQSRIRSAINALRPIGKTPLGESVKQAAKKLNFTEQKATVILISDGKENCGVDPCALGASLKKQGIDFKAHVIGFSLRQGDDAGLQCLARNTGGMYVAAKDAPSLKKALTKTVKHAAAPKPQPKPKKLAVVAGYKVRVFAKAGGSEWSGQIGVSIFTPPSGLDGKRKKVSSVWRKKSGYVFKGLKEGNYLLEVVLADHTHIKHRRDIKISKNAAQVEDVVLNIGQVRFDYSLKEGGAPYKGQAGWTVLEPKADFNGKRSKIAGFWRKKSGQVFWLPAGKWLVNGVLADATYMKVRKEIEVSAGGAKGHFFNFNGGEVRFDAKLSEEGKVFPGQLGWTILSTKTDFNGNRSKIANFWRARSGRIFVLPTGTWLLRGELADHRQVKLSTKITIEPGSQERHDFNFNAGTIRFDVTVAGQKTTDQLGLNVLTEKQDLAGKRGKVAGFWRSRSGHITILPTGKYVLTGELADRRTTRGEVLFNVAAGDQKPVTLDLTKK